MLLTVGCMLVTHDEQAKGKNKMPFQNANILTNLIAGTENKRTLTIRMIDQSGDKRAVSLPILAGATGGAIGDFVATLAGLTQASIWSVEVTEVYGVIPSNSAALEGSHDSVYDNIVVLFKDNAAIATDLFIPAPVPALLLEGDVVDTTNPDFVNLITTEQTAISAIGTAVTARFTERREINTSTSV